MRTLKYAHSFEVAPSLLPELEPLRRLAGNFRWSWDPVIERVFAEADPDAWKSSGRNPIQVLGALTPDRQEELARDTEFLARLGSAQTHLDEYLNGATWFDEVHSGKRTETLIAYFCAEFGIHESLPIYSGGLGVLAGDHLKAASDLGLPLVGVGLLYQRGYFRQQLTPDGWQQERYPDSDFYKLPLTLVRRESGEPVTVAVDLADRKVSCQIWKAQVGRVDLYLLDSNLLENEPHDQEITDTLYGGDEEMRMRQEIILGIGGYKALRAVGLDPTVCHMNEGHAAFLTLERIRDFIAQHQCDFKTARLCATAGNVFTTHTPVPAGFDIFTKEMLSRYLSGVVADLGISFEQFLAEGRLHPDRDEPFNMALLAMSNSSRINGVSKLHAKVTREMFSDRWPDCTDLEIPIQAVTNGIHTPSWIGPKMGDQLDRSLPFPWRIDPGSEKTWMAAASDLTDRELWGVRNESRQALVAYVRSRTPKVYGQTFERLSPDVLTIGFARRFATYKRATLLFRDRERLKRILNHETRPVQIVFAGKAHPRDDGGKHLIQDIKRFIEAENLQHRMVFIEDYDIGVGRELVQGVDVWLNNPRRPHEASGTSGMKVVPNGGLNCSILDGWWAEGYDPRVGWAIGTDYSSPDEAHQDWLDSESLYSLLETEIAPLFYDRNADGLPETWIEMIRASMHRLAPLYSTHRMVREYAERCYLPASSAFLNLASEGQAPAKAAQEWKSRVRAAWPAVRIVSVERAAPPTIGGVRGETGAAWSHLSDTTGGQVTAKVALGDLAPQDVSVVLIIGQVGPKRELVQPIPLAMVYSESEGNLHSFTAPLVAFQPGLHGSVVRVNPHHPTMQVATELPLVTWEETK